MTHRQGCSRLGPAAFGLGRAGKPPVAKYLEAAVGCSWWLRDGCFLFGD
jgi:hypothetical protein